MLHYAIVFFTIAIIAAVFGFGGIGTGVADFASILFLLFLALFVSLLIGGQVPTRRMMPLRTRRRRTAA